MSEPKWTMGPWLAPEERGFPILAKGRSRNVASVTWMPDTMVGFEEWNAEARANAHLIASAPTLYQELAEMVELFHGYQGMELTRAKAALAKARGESS